MMTTMTDSLLRDLDTAAHDPKVCSALLSRLEATLGGSEFRFMEVCGTHTVSIFQSGLRSLLPANVTHLSGPGCPVCVTHESEVALLQEAAKQPEIILATFGDLLRVPGPDGLSLKHLSAKGARIEVVYSPLDALEIAKKNPDRQVVFPGIGFETTAPGMAAAILKASAQKLDNFTVFSFHKLVMPALETLLQEQHSINGFLLPGHVAVITGLQPFAPLADKYHLPAVIGGFEPADILLALCTLAEMHTEKPAIKNAYPRAVTPGGNPAARQLLEKVFTPQDANWRGLDTIPQSGLAIRPEFAQFDAMKRFGLQLRPAPKLPGCKCGSILKGQLEPIRCPLFAKKCTPASPVGPCMVSTEGSCAAWYKYGEY